MAKEILINQLFAGKYLEEGENIGHEVINLFTDDDGNHNLFVTPTGFVNGHDLEYILFVRNASARRTVEVVGVAKGIRDIKNEDVNKVRYANVSLDDIFSNNIYHGEADSFANHITFRADEFCLPSKRIFITLDPDEWLEECTIHLDSERKVLIPQGMREYYSDEIDSKAYVELKSFIENDRFWDHENTTERLISDGGVQDKAPSFLEVIRKEDDENIFSNLLGYFFEYSYRSFQKFALNLLGISDMSTAFTLYRETKERVDLWIESDTDIIVIENKIKSGINGIIGDDSQLNNYYEFAQNEAEKTGKRAHFYIFAPDYAKFNLEQFGLNDTYKIVRYSEIYKFFIEETETYIADRIFPDFVRGLKRHTLSYPELQFDTMRSRLLRKISLLQQAKRR